MKIKRQIPAIAFALLLAACAALCAAAPSPVGIDATADRTSVMVGDEVRLSLKITCPADAELKTPEVGRELGGMDVKGTIAKQPKKLSGGRLMLETVYTLESFTTGTFIIPEQTAQYKLKDEDGYLRARSGRIFIEVKSVAEKIPESPADDILDIKPQLEIRDRRVMFALLAAAAVLGLGLGAFFFFRRRRLKKAIPEAEIQAPPHVRALGALERLKAACRDFRPYYFGVSSVLRHYIEERFGIPATEKTSEEFISDMMRTHAVPEESKAMLRDYLRHCDMVKFAKQVPTRKEIEDIYSLARDFIERTAPAAPDGDDEEGNRQK